MIARPLFYWTIKTIAWPVTRVYVRLRVQGRRHVPTEGPCIVVANHASYLDAVVLGSAFPRRISFLITSPIYNMLRLRWFYYMMGAIPVAPDTPDPGALKAALRTLRRGGVVGIFPEGQRMENGQLGSGKGGVALLASRSGAPVVPAAIVGAHRAMPVGAMFPRPHPIRVVFGEPMWFRPVNGARATREQLNAFAVDVMRAIGDLMDNGNSAVQQGGVRSMR
jgi:1-acyl-sn-glycerol-3-phosphate acyltransferase